MSNTRIPTTAALRAFEAAARHENFSLAARELSLTESAISRQITLLEDSIDVVLFERIKNRVKLTRAGRVYSEHVRSCLQTLERETRSITSFGAGRTAGSLDLATGPLFALRWLMPRLPAFYEKHPDIRINIRTRLDIFSFRDEHFDAAFHWGLPHWPHAISEFVFRERWTPMARRDLIGDTIREPSDLLKFPLLHSATRPRAWKQWFEAAGIPDAVVQTGGGTFDQDLMLARAAELGMGIALAPDVVLSEATFDPAVVKAYDLSIDMEEAWYFVYPEHLLGTYPFEPFRVWLLQEVNTFAEQMLQAQQNDIRRPVP